MAVGLRGCRNNEVVLIITKTEWVEVIGTVYCNIEEICTFVQFTSDVNDYWEGKALQCIEQWTVHHTLNSSGIA